MRRSLFLVWTLCVAAWALSATAEPAREEEGIVVAALPAENLSGTAAPLKEFRAAMVEGLRKRGVAVLEDDRLEAFMAGHRIRFTGGLDPADIRAIKAETGASAVLVTSFGLLSEVFPPKIGVTARLVSTGMRPEILWMDSRAMCGDDSPGLFGLGLVRDPRDLMKRAADSLADSLAGALSGAKGRPQRKGGCRAFLPKVHYRFEDFRPAPKASVATVPFLNLSSRRHAGELMALHFVEQLRSRGRFAVIEPGSVRHEILRSRIILNKGLTLPDADYLFENAGADLILTGTVTEYRDYDGPAGTPGVAFSLFVLEKKSRTVVWSSTSYNEGSDAESLFEWGKRKTAHALASEMARCVADLLGEGI